MKYRWSLAGPNSSLSYGSFLCVRTRATKNAPGFWICESKRGASSIYLLKLGHPLTEKPNLRQDEIHTSRPIFKALPAILIKQLGVASPGTPGGILDLSPEGAQKAGTVAFSMTVYPGIAHMGVEKLLVTAFPGPAPRS